MKQFSEATLFGKLFSASKADLPALTVMYGRQFVADYPDLDIAWLMLGRALTDIANYEEAEKAIARAIELFPPKKRYMGSWEMGRLYEQRGDFEQAMTWYRQVIGALPADARGYVYVGGLLAKQGRLHEAEQIHRAATERCDESRGLEEAWLNLGLVLRAQERFEEAANCFKETMQIDPGNRPARKALRDVERCLKRTEKPD
jgi:tetratricopeptide (TPR) repeat protein